ncbi:hypothetical protein BNJ_00407 [Kaumoebavirus]|uniref:hypothetical protein n=1 Tax=Kaumoebavirus TaxID=1859492 RepID=UPI0009C2B883|nr:hypothetical protein BNJ_00407 [Kaumoebavirus]ARA72225.1 hypothetical protein BNJ_00407 [Kaumoebavirus]
MAFATINTLYFPMRVKNTRDYNIIEEHREQFPEAKLIIVHEKDGDYVKCWEAYKKDIVDCPLALDEVYNAMPKPSRNLVRSVDVEDFIRMYQAKMDSLRELRLFFRTSELKVIVNSQ